VARAGSRRQGLRRLLALVVGMCFVPLGAAGCGGEERSATTTEPARPATSTERAGFDERFARYEPAPEPDGDLDRVVWPDYELSTPTPYPPA
jgi:hypothetical protein